MKSTFHFIRISRAEILLDAMRRDFETNYPDCRYCAGEAWADEDLAQKMCILLNDGIEAVDDGSGEFKLELVEDNYDFVEE